MTPGGMRWDAVVEACRRLMEAGLCLWIQSALLLACGLLASHTLRRRGPAFSALLGKATLAAVALCLLIACLPRAPLGLWTISLPRAAASDAPHTARQPPVMKTGSGWRSASRPHGRKEPHPSLSLSKERVPFRASLSLSKERDRGRGVSAQADTGPQATQRRNEFRRDGEKLDPLSASERGGTARDTRNLSRGEVIPIPQLSCAYVGLAMSWLGGALALLAWQMACQASLWRLRRRCRTVQEGAAWEELRALCGASGARPPLLLAHPQVRSPFLAGLFRPAILLPDDFASDFDRQAIRAILTHELTHLRHRDCAWLLLSRLCGALLWPQPLLWILCRRMRQAGEEVCDQAALAGADSPRAYAESLLLLAEQVAPARFGQAAGVGMASSRPALSRRIERILDGSLLQERIVTMRTRVLVLACTFAAACCALVLAGTGPKSSAQTAPIVPSPHSQPTANAQASSRPNRAESLPVLAVPGQKNIQAAHAAPPANTPDTTRQNRKAKAAAGAARIAARKREAERRSLLQAQKTAIYGDIIMRLEQARILAAREEEEAALKYPPENPVRLMLNTKLALLDNRIRAYRQKWSLSLHAATATQADRDALRARQAAMQQTKAGGPAYTESAIRLQQLYRELRQAKAELARRREIYTEAHPQVQKAKRRLVEIEKTLLRSRQASIPAVRIGELRVLPAEEPNQEGQEWLSYTYQANAADMGLVVTADLIADYYDASEKLLRTIPISLFRSQSQGVVHTSGRQISGGPYAVKSMAPAGAVTARYRYEIRGEIVGAAGAAASDKATSKARTIELSEINLPSAADAGSERD